MKQTDCEARHQTVLSFVFSRLSWPAVSLWSYNLSQHRFLAASFSNTASLPVFAKQNPRRDFI